ncbi:MAG: MBL fold metallo-hydrolase [Lachnospiraceae bacterium]|nr:MBL fold metallo-hydrolase [Lachnospiraceae bacterium]
MIVHTMTLNALLTHTYFIFNEETLETLIVDPAWDTKAISDYIDENGLKPVAVLLTHGHFDHIYGVQMLKDRGIKVIAPERKENFWEIQR